MNKDLIFQKLVCHGLFPEKIEDIFSSEKFGQWVISNTTTLNIPSRNRYLLLQYKQTRNNNSPRHMGIPHPLGFINLCKEISKNWGKIENKIQKVPNYKETSMIKIKIDNKNKRLYSMASYDKNSHEEQIHLDKQFGKKYFVHADISNHYPSIYTHSISWALVGKKWAKKYQMDHNKWYNKLDKAYRNVQDGETIGLPIGPDTSAIFSEIILSQIDKKLSKYDYVRYIDDYKCFCASKKEADNFIRDLSCEIEEYRLKLNTKKTKISLLPKAINEDWVRKLKHFIEWKEISKINKNKILAFLDLSSELFQKNPGESPIRYAAQVLKKKTFKDYSSYKLILRYFLNLCFLFPYVIDICDELIETGINTFPSQKNEIKKTLQEAISKILEEHIQYRRTDVISWSLFLGIKYELIFSKFDKLTKKIFATKDCIPLTMCFLYRKFNNQNINKFKTLLSKIDSSKWWLYIYEVSRIENIALSNPEMEKLRKAKISFLSEKLHHIIEQKLTTRKHSSRISARTTQSSNSTNNTKITTITKQHEKTWKN